MRRIIIVGASSGIGREVALLYMKAGWKVGIAARRKEALEELQALYPGQVETETIDVTRDDAADKLLGLIRRTGGTDVFLLCSGIGFQNPGLEPEIEIRTVRTNTEGFVRLTDAAFRYFEQNGGGQIAVISSIAGTKGLGIAPAYSATKRFQNTYIDALEQLAHLKNLSIRFTDIRPGFVDTDLLKDGNYPLLMRPGQVARHIVQAINRKKRVAVIDWKYQFIVFFWRLIPRCLWKVLPIKRKSPTLLIGLLVLLSATLPLLFGSILPGQHESPQSEMAAFIVSPQIPEKASFAGKEIDLTRYDLRERMDRELTSFAYLHATTLLLIKRANRYFPVIEPILKANGIPEDFKYLMTIESNLDGLARSPAGAAGLWQFTEATAREKGLEVTANVDERYHIQKATQAACRYLKEAYAKYGDWITVAASYNAGQGRISAERNKQAEENALDLWLNQETSRYMFRILAIKEIFHHPKRYGFLLKRENLYPVMEYREIKVDSAVADLTRFARQQGVSYARLKDANLWLRDSSLENKQNKTYTLLIPTRESMYYHPKQTVAYHKYWVID